MERADVFVETGRVDRSESLSRFLQRQAIRAIGFLFWVVRFLDRYRFVRYERRAYDFLARASSRGIISQGEYEMAMAEVARARSLSDPVNGTALILSAMESVGLRKQFQPISVHLAQRLMQPEHTSSCEECSQRRRDICIAIAAISIGCIFSGGLIGLVALLQRQVDPYADPLRAVAYTFAIGLALVGFWLLNVSVATLRLDRIARVTRRLSSNRTVAYLSGSRVVLVASGLSILGATLAVHYVALIFS